MAATASELIEPAPTTRTDNPASTAAGARLGAGACGPGPDRAGSRGSPSRAARRGRSPTLTRLAPARSMPVSACARLPARSASEPRSDSARPSVPCSLASLQGLAHLAEYLALADDHGVEPAGHREQVLDGAVLVVHVQVRGQLGQRDSGVPGQQLADRRDAAVELADLGVDLHPVAGAQHERARDVVGAETSRSSLDSASPVSTARSSVATGALVWLSPTTSTLMSPTACASTPCHRPLRRHADVPPAAAEPRGRRAAVPAAPATSLAPGYPDHRPALRVEGEDLQLDRQVDLTHIHPGWHV